MHIPFVDLYAQYLSIKSPINTAINKILEETSFVGGKYVKEFEENFANAYNIKHCIGVGNGTDALYSLLKMLGIGQGDEVITVANSWISTSETITQTGATPVFVDVDEYFTIDITQIEAKISIKTKAIIPVHLYGQAADIIEIKAICDKYKIFLIEDCAQAHFTKFANQYVGTFGIAATFSFYPSKNLGAYGDAGCIITNNHALAEKIRMYTNHGSLIKHQHVIEGVNSRLDSIQAAILNVKLNHIFDWNKKRIQNALSYTENLKDIPQITLPKIRNNTQHTYHLYVIKTSYRADLQRFLKEKNIETAIHYPIALPFLSAYSYMKHKTDDFPITAKNQNEILSLPMYPELKLEAIKYITDHIKYFFERL